MKDWTAYLKSKASTLVWGAIALDYYVHWRQEHGDESGSDYIDWLIGELFNDETDLPRFHKVLLATCVQLLGQDFDSIIGKSLLLIRNTRVGLDRDALESITVDYGPYGQDSSFTQRLKEDKEAQGKLTAPALEYLMPVRPKITKPSKEAAVVLPQDADVRLCHITDLHFGIYHAYVKLSGVDHLFERTDHFINFLRSEKREGRAIDLLVISGDVTSVASDDEYAEFVKFLQSVESVGVMTRGPFWERVVLVPGNHEVRRGEKGGRGDYLRSFQQFVDNLKGQGRVVASPYSQVGEGACVFASSSKEGVPYALHRFPVIKVEVLSLVSSYYSHGLDQEVCSLIKRYDEIKAALGSGVKEVDIKTSLAELEKFFLRRLYLDKGCFTIDYVGKVPSDLTEFYKNSMCGDTFIRIAVAHHHASKYFDLSDIPDTANSLVLLSGLKALGFTAYLHGHIHSAVPPSGTMPLEISSAALGGTPSEGGSGFNLIECRRIDNEWKDVHLNRYELRQGQYKCCETATLDLA